MGYVRKVRVIEKAAEEELAEIERQLDIWKIPRRAGIGQDGLTLLGRIRLLRNNAVTIVAEVRADRDRLQRRLDEIEEDL